MKTQFIKIFAVGFTLATALLTIGCKENELVPKPSSDASGARQGFPGPIKILKFDPMTMKKEIDKFLGSRNLSGYAYTIFMDGKRVLAAEGSDGFARKAVDAPGVSHSPTRRQEIASCSKYITTLAMINTLEQAELNLDTPIGNYLPIFMKAIPSVKAITFRQLLSHHSGLVGGISDINITLNEMQQSVQTSNMARYDTYQYNNMNFALCRFLLVYVQWRHILKWNSATISNMENTYTQKEFDDILAVMFRGFVRTYVFKPAGLVDWVQLGATDPATNWPTLYYINSQAGGVGVTSNSLSTVVNLGSAGFDLSAVELAQITSAAKDYKIVSKSWLNAMRLGYKNYPLGFNGMRTGAYGQYYYKYGGISLNVDNHTGGLATMLVDFDCPQANVQVVIVSNDDDPGVSNINWIQAAFDKSW